MDLQNGTVTFRYKDYAHGSQTRSMTLSLEEFLRRFGLYILFQRFVKIRHYGLLANRDSPIRIAQARALLAKKPSLLENSQESVPTIKHVESPALVCPHCGHPTLILIRVINRPKSLPICDTS